MQFNNLYALVEHGASKYGDSYALIGKCENGKSMALSFKEFRDKVSLIARGLIYLGLKKSNTVCLIADTKLFETTLIDFGIIACGCITVSISSDLDAKDIISIVNDSEASFIFLDERKSYLIEKGLDIQNIIYITPPKEQDVQDELSVEKMPYSHSSKKSYITSLDDLTKLGVNIDKALFEERLLSISLGDIASILYTSGTTEKPKGVILSHQNIFNAMSALGDNLPSIKGLYTCHIMPLAYIDGKVLQFFCIYSGAVQCYIRDYNDIQKIRPNFIFSSPYFLKWAYEHLLVIASGEDKLTYSKSFSQRWILNILNRLIPDFFTFINNLYYVNKQAKNEDRLGHLKERLLRYALQKSLSTLLGDKLSFFFVSGEPLADDFIKLFTFLGINLFEGYSITELSSLVYINIFSSASFHENRGFAINGSCIRLSGDNEILIKSSNLMFGYYKDRGEFRQDLLDEDWLSTGDVGTMDKDGILRVLGRASDLITTSSGNKFSPVSLEVRIQARSYYIKEIFVYGADKSFVSALIVLDRDKIKKAFLGNKQVNLKRYIQEPAIISFVESELDRINKSLEAYEEIGRFAIIEKGFSDLIDRVYTPTNKLRRSLIIDKYKKLFDQFYEERYN